jgi:hypothetical protein
MKHQLMVKRIGKQKSSTSIEHKKHQLFHFLKKSIERKRVLPLSPVILRFGSGGMTVLPVYSVRFPDKLPQNGTVFPLSH